MDKNKKQWSKPVLIVLSDWKPDEFALLACVGAPTQPNACSENSVRTTS